MRQIQLSEQVNILRRYLHELEYKIMDQLYAGDVKSKISDQVRSAIMTKEMKVWDNKLKHEEEKDGKVQKGREKTSVSKTSSNGA